MSLKRKHILAGLLVIFLFLLNFQMLGVGGWLAANESSLKVYQVFLPLFIPFFFNFKLPIKQGHILVYAFMVVVLVSSVLYFFYGFNPLIFNYVFAFALFFLGLLIASRFEERKILSLFQFVIIIVNIIILLKLVYFREQILNFFKFRYGGHPYIYYFYGGGPNLEATWVAMNTLFFINRKRLFYLILAFSFAISAIYASRVGLILTVLVFGIYFFSKRISKLEKQVIILLAVIIGLGFGYVIAKKSTELYVIERLTNIGSKGELGSQGRLRIWKAYAENFSAQNVLGVGAGNSIPYIERKGEIEIRENNLHNYYMQTLMDFGLLGLFAFLLLGLDVTDKNLRIKFYDPFGVYVLCYFIACLIQFRGAENYVWLAYGIFLGNYYKTRLQLRESTLDKQSN